MQRLTLALIATTFLTVSFVSHAQTLKGSRASMERQNQIAIRQGYTFVKTSNVVTGLVSAGDLVEVRGDRNFELHDVSYPYARPAVKSFIDRLSSQYRGACGEKLTVTSLTRPIDRQPANASSDSVHPTGMAVDLRIPSKQSCRTWLENYLLALEADDVLDVTRERRPPHYHVAVFPDTYEQYIADLSTTTEEYTVRRGDTLSRIASTTGTSVAQLRAFNGLRNDLLQVGQKLLVRPAANATAEASTAAVVATEPAVPAVLTVTSSQSSQATEVTVRRGDTLSRIASKEGVSIAQLRAINGLRNDVLQVGQKLVVRPGANATAETSMQASVPEVIAASAAASSQSSQVTEVIVRRGDSLSRIASRTGTSVEQLRTVNRLRSDTLQVGQKLLIRTMATNTNASTAAIAQAVTTPNANQVAAAAVSTHRVKRGETLWRIAKLYGTTTDALSAKNGLASDILQVGQTLTVE